MITLKRAPVGAYSSIALLLVSLAGCGTETETDSPVASDQETQNSVQDDTHSESDGENQESNEASDTSQGDDDATDVSTSGSEGSPDQTDQPPADADTDEPSDGAGETPIEDPSENVDDSEPEPVEPTETEGTDTSTVEDSETEQNAGCDLPKTLFDGVDADYQVPVEYLPHLNDDERCEAQIAAYEEAYGLPDTATYSVSCPGPLMPGHVSNTCNMQSTYHYTCAGYSIGFAQEYMSAYCRVGGQPLTEESRQRVADNIAAREALQAQTGASWRPLFIAQFDGYYNTVFQTRETAALYHDLHYAIREWEECYLRTIGVASIADDKLHVLLGDFPSDTLVKVEGEYAISPDGSLFLNPDIVSLSDELKKKVKTGYAQAQFLSDAVSHDFDSSYALYCANVTP